MRKTQLQAGFTDETIELLNRWSKEFGITRSQLIALSCRAGINHIIAAVSPADAFTPEKLAEIIKISQIETEVPNEE